GVYEIGQNGDMLLLYIEDLDMNKVNRLAQRLRGRIKVRSAGKPHIAVSMVPGDEQLELLTRIFGIFASSSG
ncbi:MAG: hypothetical protein GXZ02_08425, partial [Clostridiales bacterium]|nr:hypothetical protein [Clostridiales bacterium]